ncbi:RnfABCDGE type electron transport complex subunit D [Candidatus Gottesmanbacteria bacterium]|nr:RnfABCDGE type electron transport complex subunit D [Candidatus Gottesmanbacteria bacterium]
MNAKMVWADSRGKVIALLVLLWLAALVHEFRAGFVISVVFAVAASVGLDTLINWIGKKTTVVSLSSVVTGLLIGLVFDPFAGPVATLTACAIASLSKAYLGAGEHQHVFNPAALGIAVSSLLFGRSVAWWAASWGMLPVVILAAGMLPVVWRLHRQWMGITFLIVYYFLTRSISLTFDGTVFLFAFVMLPEPRTAPMRGAWAWGWGVLVGLLVFVQNLLGYRVGDPLLLALLVANLYSFFIKYGYEILGYARR